MKVTDGIELEARRLSATIDCNSISTRWTTKNVDNMTRVCVWGVGVAALQAYVPVYLSLQCWTVSMQKVEVQ